MKKKALFISHEASATGAPVFYLEFIKQFKSNNSNTYEVDVVLIKDGVLNSSFAELGRVCLLDSKLSLEDQKNQLLNFISADKYEFAYYNTLESAHVLSWLQSFQSQISNHFFHIHELEGTISRYGGSSRIRPIDQFSDHIITVSQPVCDNLVQNHSFDVSKISVIPPFTRRLNLLNAAETAAWKKSKGLDGRKIVLACGEIGACKGTDFFVQVAISYSATVKNLSSVKDKLFFLWLGPDPKKEQLYYEKEIQLKNAQDYIQFCGFDANVEPYFNACDVFLMCSREDSHPLVCLEAASLKKPVIFFEEAGGIGSFFKNNTGFRAKFADIDSVMSNIYKVLEDKSSVEANVNSAFMNYDEFYNPKKMYKHIADTINNKTGKSLFN